MNRTVKLLLRVGIPIVAIVVILAALPVYGRMTSSSRISPALARQLTTGQPYYSVQVQFGFRPQYFNLQKLQAIGTLAGTNGDTCKVLDVTAGQVHEIADLYWVKHVVTLGEAQ
jgi:FlaG/FlaF family flagellin (archaellin)